MLPPPKTRRCRYYDVYGEVIGKKCPYDAHPRTCNFIHPTDREWGGRSRSPPGRRDSGYSARSRSRSRTRRSRSPVRRSPVRRRSRSRDMSYRRPSSVESERRSRLPERPSSITSTIPDRKSSWDPPQGPRSLMSAFDQSQNKEIPITPVLPSPSTGPIPPPHPLAPSLIPAPKPKPMLEEKRKIWVNRIKLMSECCAARMEHMKWEKDVRDWRRLIHAPNFRDLPTEEQQKFQSNHDYAVTECEKVKEEMNTAVKKLLDLDEFWPALINSDDGGSKGILEQLKKDVADLREQVRSTSDHSTQVEDTAVVLGQKRKRSMTDEGGPRLAEKVVEQLKDEIQALAGRISDQENETLQREDDITSTLNDDMDSRIEALAKDWEKTTGHTQKRLKELSTSHSELKNSVAEMEFGMKETTDIVTVLDKEIKDVKTATDLLGDQNAARYDEHRQLGVKLLDLEEARKQDLERIFALERENTVMKEMLQSSLERISQQSTQPPPPSIEQILEAALEPLQARIRTSLKPYLMTHHAEIETMLRHNNEALCKGVWEKLQLTLQMTETIMAWMERLQADTAV